MNAKPIKVASVVVGGPVFAFAVLWFGCTYGFPALGDYCSPHLWLGPLAGFTVAFWLAVPAIAMAIRAFRRPA